MRRNPERLAWTILLIAFTICCGLGVGLPLLGRWYVLNAPVRQDAVLEVQRGTLRLQLAGRGEPVGISGSRGEIPEGTVIASDAVSQGLLTTRDLGSEPAVVATLQVYHNTECTLLEARSPRFQVSPLPHQVTVEIHTGRVRIGVAGDQGRAVRVEVRTPHATATLTRGSYAIEVTEGATHVTVRDGKATIAGIAGGVVPLGPAQRTEVAEGEEPAGVLPAERNLIVNGNFRAPLEEVWSVYNEVHDPETPEGEVTILSEEGRQVANFKREGVNHAETGIVQELNADVRDFSSLQLHMGVRLLEQSIGGCGIHSSECPIIVRIDYRDIHDTDREWYHGFYFQDPPEDWFLTPWAEKVPGQTWQTYDSGNLVESFEEPPATIQAIRIYASGHSYHAMVTEVELLAQE